MGKINPSVLYFDLLEDLSFYFPGPVFDQLQRMEEVEPWPGISTEAFAALALSKAFLKKFKDYVNEGADGKALEKFLQVNEACKNYRYPGSSFADSSCYTQEYTNELLGCLKQAIWRFYVSMPQLDFGSILDRGRVGPGASIGALGPDFYTKLFASPLSATKDCLYSVFERYISDDPRWNSANELRKISFPGPLITEGNRLSFVPKTVDVTRTICTEPSVNMMFQLGLGELICDQLRRSFGIDLKSQQFINRELARIGSIDGSFGTIDLSSASDSISITMLREVLPREFFAWLDLFRCSYSTLPDGRRIELHMISTMGNGYTFPLQTMLFACVVEAVYQARGVSLRRYGPATERNFAVNGDDIIVTRECYKDVVFLLTLLGFSVNAKKSFNEGFFRESCGFDAWKGVNVRGVYIESLAMQQDRYSAINRLNRWSARHRIPLWRVIHRLLRTVKPIMVPREEQDEAGIHVPKWCLSGLSKDENGSYRYQRWIPIPASIRVTEDAIVVPKGMRKRIFNPEGLVIAFLMGVIRDHRFPIRHDWATYGLSKAVTPNWERLPKEDTGLDPASWRYWESIVGSFFA